MEIELPNGTIIYDVPEGASKDEIMEKAINKGLATRQDFGLDPDPDPQIQVRVPITEESEGPGFLDRVSDAADYVGETVSNIPGSMYDVAKDTLNAIMNPIDTATALGNVAGGAIQKFHPDAVRQDLVPYADAAGDYYADRYGGLGQIAETVKTDPAGAVTDLLLAGSVVPKSGKLATVASALETADPLAKAVSLTGRGLGRLPNAMQRRSLGMPSTMSPIERTAVAQTALDQGIMATPGGYYKMEGMLNAARHTVNEDLARLEAAGITIPLEDVTRYIPELWREFSGFRYGSGQARQVLARELSRFMDDHEIRGTVTPTELQEFKIDLQNKINYKTPERKQKPKARVQDAMARGARHTIEEIAPGVAEHNQLMSELLALKPHMTRRLGVEDTRALLGFQPMMGGVAASVASGSPMVGLAAGTGIRAASSARFQSGLAMAAEAIRRRGAPILYDNPIMAITRDLMREGAQIDEVLPAE